MASQPIEVTESEQPLQITAYEFIQDAMGPGRFRGGAPFRREYRLLAEEAILQVRAAVLSEDGRLRRYFADKRGHAYRRHQPARRPRQTVAAC